MIMTDTAVNARPFGIRDKIGYALGMLVFPFKYTEAGASVDVLSIVVWTVLLMIANVGNGLFGVIVWAMVVDCIYRRVRETKALSTPFILSSASSRRVSALLWSLSRWAGWDIRKNSVPTSRNRSRQI